MRTVSRIYEKILYNIIFQRNISSFLRSKGTRIGKNCEIQNKISDFGSEPWLIEIGDNVTLAVGVVFLTHDGSSRIFRNNFDNMSKFGNKFGSITIKDNCFIGTNTIILPGIKVGPNSIIGAGSIVTKDVPPNSIFAGNPAKLIYSLDEYIISYSKKMIILEAQDRKSLRSELTRRFWGEER
jgi:acetyltransferase-like isoleucine patch superfamily enzyme